MQAQKIKIFKSLLSVAILVCMVMILASRCATISAPLGGPYDTLPPRILLIDPGYGKTNFDSKRITITFDEYILLQNQSSEFYTSPVMEKTPTLTIRNKSLQIDFDSPLDSNTTYALNFGNTVVDNNEGNAYTGLRYVFSTGDYIDSMLMSGYAVDASTGDSLSNVYVYFFDHATADSLMRLSPWDTVALDQNIMLASDTLAADTATFDTLATQNLVDSVSKEQLVELDSILYKVKANAVARTFSNGIFIAENLAAKDYRIYAFQDNNSNKVYDPGVDLVAFTDSVYNPENMPPFDIWYDTIQRRLQADPQTYFRLFQETVEPAERVANLAAIQRPERQRVYVTFTGPNPQIEAIEFDSIPSDSIITEFLTVGKDTISLWLNVLPDNLPDTVGGRLVFNKADSLGVMVPDTTRFDLSWFDSAARERERGRNRDEEEDVEEPKLEISPRTSGSRHNLHQKIELSFTMPLQHIDTASIELIREPLSEGEQARKVDAILEQDTVNIRRWWLSTPNWQPDEQYTLTIPEGAMRDIAGLTRDTLTTEFTIDSPERYATFLINVNNADEEKEYIIQILSGKNVAVEKAHVTAGQTRIEYINPGDVRIRVIEDTNGNGIWDTGDLRLRRQPETIAMFAEANGNQTITAKLNWEMEFDIDMNTLFAPITMDDMMSKIQLIEQEAQRIRDERRQAQQK